MNGLLRSLQRIMYVLCAAITAIVLTLLMGVMIFVVRSSDGIVIMAFITAWLITLFIGSAIEQYAPRMSFFMRFAAVFGIALVLMTYYIFEWRFFGFGSGLTYGVLPSGPPQVEGRILLPLASCYFIAWGLQSRDAAILQSGIWVTAATVVITVSGILYNKPF